MGQVFRGRGADASFPTGAGDESDALQGCRGSHDVLLGWCLMNGDRSAAR
jgi:hypothetical protein